MEKYPDNRTITIGAYVYVQSDCTGKAHDVITGTALGADLASRRAAEGGSGMKCLLWDFDGTLAYRKGGWQSALAEAARRELPEIALQPGDLRPYLRSGFPWHQPERVRSPGQPADEWWAQLETVFESAFIQAAGLSSGRARRIARRVREVYLEMSWWRLFDDTLDCLGALAAEGWKHVIVSNHVPELPDIVRRLGLSPYVSAIYNSASLGVEKPNPKIFQMVLADLQPGGDVWMIGDNPVADVEGAEAVGINAVLARTEDPRAKRRVASLREAPLLLGLAGGRRQGGLRCI